MVLALIINNKLILFGVLVFALLLFLLSKIKPKVFLRRMVFVTPFLLFLLLFNIDSFLLVSMKVLSSILLVAFITNNFSLYSVSGYLKKIGVPEYLRDIFLLAFRFSFDLVSDVKRINKAVKIRGVYSRKKLFTYSSLGNLIGIFFVRSVARSNNVYKAMKLKGY